MTPTMTLNPELPCDPRELERMLRAAKDGLASATRCENHPHARNCRFMIRELRNQLHVLELRHA